MPSNDFCTKDKVTTFCSDLIDTEIKRRNFQASGEVFNPCEITQCDRRILFRTKGYPEEFTVKQKVDGWLQQQTHNACKDKWLNFFSYSIKANTIERDVTRADINYNLYGVLDAVMKIGDLPIVLMIKPVYDRIFQKVVAEGAIRKHVVEQMVKMWLAEIPHGLILYDNLETGAYTLFHVTPFKPLLEAIRKKCTKLNLVRLKGGLAQRAYKAKALECSVCEFNKRCWETENQ